MHEYSIVTALIEQCDELAIQNKAKSIHHIVIKIGVLSGVEPELLRTAFDAFKLDSFCTNATLEIIVQPLIILCNRCNKQYTNNQTVICPNCDSHETTVIDGEQMTLMQLEIEN